MARTFPCQFLCRKCCRYLSTLPCCSLSDSAFRFYGAGTKESMFLCKLLAMTYWLWEIWLICNHQQLSATCPSHNVLVVSLDVKSFHYPMQLTFYSNIITIFRQTIMQAKYITLTSTESVLCSIQCPFLGIMCDW